MWWNKKKCKKVTKQIIVEKAMTDQIYRQKLISNPQNAIQEYFNITLPPGLELIVVEETDNRFYLVIPRFHNEDDLPYCDENVTGTW
jgi:hypothetical protein